MTTSLEILDTLIQDADTTLRERVEQKESNRREYEISEFMCRLTRLLGEDVINALQSSILWDDRSSWDDGQPYMQFSYRNYDWKLRFHDLSLFDFDKYLLLSVHAHDQNWRDSRRLNICDGRTREAFLVALKELHNEPPF